MNNSDTDAMPGQSGEDPEEGSLRSVVRGSRPGDHYVRVVRARELPIERRDPTTYVVRDEIPRGRAGQAYERFQRFLVGRPLESAKSAHQRLGKRQALAVFSSDALSSTSYATEEIMLVLVLAGAVGLSYLLPIAIAISVLLAIVVFSYRQTIYAYPTGGGAYTVTRENLGRRPSLVAASALLTDYILTAAVSISAGTAAITSAVPELLPYRVQIGVAALFLVALINLRGVRESGTIFAIPTYAFIFAMGMLIILGVGEWLSGSEPEIAVQPAEEPVHALTFLLVLRAFSSGCAALTGVEAISNGVPAFEEPASRNAARTLVIMAVILVTIFLGITLLAEHYALVPNEEETIVSQLARATVGENPFYYGIQAATAGILFLAANTSFADFPRVASVLSNDRFLPHQFSYRGDRLVYSTGIIALAVLSSALVIGFGADVSALIGMYAVGVFVSFTLSQYGMVRHWRAMPPSRQRATGMVISSIGAATTGLVALIIIETKFIQGAWAVVVIIPVLMFAMSRVYEHYRSTADQLRMSAAAIFARRGRARTVGPVLVPISSLNHATVLAIEYATMLSRDVTVVNVVDDLAAADELREKWRSAGMRVPLVVVESPYRELIGPLVQFAEQLHDEKGGAHLTVVVPEFVPVHFWHLLLHNQSAWRLRFALWRHPGIVVTSVPFHLRR